MIAIVLAAGLLAQAKATLAQLDSFVCHERIVRNYDTIDADLSYHNGKEEYSNILVRPESELLPDYKLSSISELSGPWSMGEYGTLLKETITQVETGKRGNWTLHIGNDTYNLTYKTKVEWTFDTIQRVATGGLPKRIKSIIWEVSIGLVNGEGYRLPKTAAYQIHYKDGRVERNVMTFSDYRQMRVESRLIQ